MIEKMWDPKTAGVDTKSELTPRVTAKREKQATARLKQAKQLLKSKPAAAKDRLEKIVAEFPGTSAADQASDLLKELDSN